MNGKISKLLKDYSEKAGVSYRWLKKEYNGLSEKQRGDFVKEIMWVSYQLDKLKEEKHEK